MRPENIKKLRDALHEMRQQYYSRIAEELRSTTRTYKEVGNLYGVSAQTVYFIARLHGLSRATGGGAPSPGDQALEANDGNQ